MSITRTITIDDITPAELAVLFTDMADEGQAEFFAAIKPIAAEWPGAGWCQQSYAISRRLDRDGREVILKLVEHILDCDNIETLVAKSISEVQP